jgi:serine phosphatase RsbU (regulator of sigma subunit)
VGGREEDALRSSTRLAAVAETGLVGTGPEEVFDDLATLAAQLVDAPLAFITIVDDQRCWWKSVVGRAAGDARSSVAEESLCHYLIGSGRTLIVEDAANDERVRRYRSIAELGIGAWAGSPVWSEDGEILGSLCVVDTVPRRWSSQDVRVVAALAGAASREIRLRSVIAAHLRSSAESSRSEARLGALAAQAAVLSESLQVGLLPALDPAVLGISVESRYLPGEDRLLLGGDLFDLTRTPDGSLAFLIGDVAGHGPVPAAVGASLRAAWRALALTQDGSAHWIDGLERVVASAHLDAELFVTLSTGTIEPGFESVTLRSAGHPPPLLRHGDGRVEVLEVDSGPPVGLGDGVSLRPPTTVPLEAGWSLLLCTDGLFEGRQAPGSTQRVGLEAVAQRFAALSAEGGPDEEVLDRLLEFVTSANGGPIEDDVAVLLLQAPHPGGGSTGT